MRKAVGLPRSYTIAVRNAFTQQLSMWAIMPRHSGAVGGDRAASALKAEPDGRAAVRPLFRMPGHARKGALTLHVLTSVGWFGIAVAVVFCLIVARTTSDQALGHALYLAIGVTPWVAVPAGLAGTATGAVLGLSSRYGLIRNWWVFGKLIITAVVVLTDAVVTGSLANAAVTGRLSPALMYAYTMGHVLLLALATVLSVFKPRGRTPWKS